jgi:indolepyruvate ferredoxin oxidoreductase beta subunit
MKKMDIILAGLGGQGILFMTKILAQSATNNGFNVMGAETHGMAQRGGSVISHLRLGEVESSLIRTGTANCLLALEESEAYRNIPFLAEEGRMYANSSKTSFPRKEVDRYLQEMKIICRSIAATDLAMEMAAPMASNLALLGFFSAFNKEPLNNEELRKTIDQISPSRFKEINLRVFEEGYKIGRDEKD